MTTKKICSVQGDINRSPGEETGVEVEVEVEVEVKSSSIGGFRLPWP